MARSSDIDDVMRDVMEREQRDSGELEEGGEEREIEDLSEHREDKTTEYIGPKPERKFAIGRVEHFFGKLGVAAVRLTGTLRVGDIIEIQGIHGATRQRVSEMQIDREPVEVASYGNDVGIKLEEPVSEGSDVYLIG